LEKPVLPLPLLKAVIQLCLQSGGHRNTDVAKKENVEEQGDTARVLLVEDTELNQVLMRTILEKEGNRVTLASDGVEALESLADNDFDLVLMDIQMPTLDGLTTTKIVRSLEKGEDPQIPEAVGIPNQIVEQLSKKLKGRKTPIVAVTAHAFEEERQKSIEAGIDLHLTKPLIMEDFRTAVRKFVTKGTCVTEEHKSHEQHRNTISNIEELKSYLIEAYDFSESDLPQFIKTAARSILKNIENAEQALERGDYRTLQESLHSINILVRL
jgi:CheY-like chemotaxis protein